MINGFSKQTAPITEDERITYLPVILKELKNTSPGHPIDSSIFKNRYGIDGARLRKIINHIRLNRIIPNVAANSAGYFLEPDPVKLYEYAESLRQRSRAIDAVADALHLPKEPGKQVNLFQKSA